ncbi:hypothetical protein DFH27DRAFT_98104 [Peziza echinospora]|nr:hypothetical protein DFH27DRAFT_98104 [Peziza echinospora]
MVNLVTSTTDLAKHVLNHLHVTAKVEIMPSHGHCDRFRYLYIVLYMFFGLLFCLFVHLLSNSFLLFPFLCFSSHLLTFAFFFLPLFFFFCLVFVYTWHSRVELNETSRLMMTSPLAISFLRCNCPCPTHCFFVKHTSSLNSAAAAPIAKGLGTERESSYPVTINVYLNYYLKYINDS